MSSEKTNKSFRKRLKLTKKGKVVSRKPGLNHYNAKESRQKQLIKKQEKNVDIKNKDLSRNLPHG